MSMDNQIVTKTVAGGANAAQSTNLNDVLSALDGASVVLFAQGFYNMTANLVLPQGVTLIIEENVTIDGTGFELSLSEGRLSVSEAVTEFNLSNITLDGGATNGALLSVAPASSALAFNASNVKLQAGSGAAALAFERSLTGTRDISLKPAGDGTAVPSEGRSFDLGSGFETTILPKVYQEMQGEIALTKGLIEIESTLSFKGATIAINEPRAGDSLTFVQDAQTLATLLRVTLDYNADTGVLSITPAPGRLLNASIVELLLEAVRFENTTTQPGTSRTFAYTLTDKDGGTLTATAILLINDLNEAPALQLNAIDDGWTLGTETATFVQGGAAVDITTAAEIKLNDAEDDAINFVSVRITDAVDTTTESLLLRSTVKEGDLFGLSPTQIAEIAGVTVTYDAATATLTLSASEGLLADDVATTDLFEYLLNDVKYANTSANPAAGGNKTRTFEVIAKDALNENPLQSSSLTFSISIEADDLDLINAATDAAQMRAAIEGTSEVAVLLSDEKFTALSSARQDALLFDLVQNKPAETGYTAYAQFTDTFNPLAAAYDAIRLAIAAPSVATIQAALNALPETLTLSGEPGLDKEALQAQLTTFATLTVLEQPILDATAAAVGVDSLVGLVAAAIAAAPDVVVAAVNDATTVEQIQAILADVFVYASGGAVAGYGALQTESKDFAALALLQGKGDDYADFAALETAFTAAVALGAAGEDFVAAANAGDVAGLIAAAEAASEALKDITIGAFDKADLDAAITAFKVLPTGSQTAVANDLKASAGDTWTLPDLYASNLLALTGALVGFRVATAAAVAEASDSVLTLEALEAVADALTDIAAKKENAKVNGTDVTELSAGAAVQIGRLIDLTPNRLQAVLEDVSTDSFTSFTQLSAQLNTVLVPREAVQSAVNALLTDAKNDSGLEVADFQAVQTALQAIVTANLRETLTDGTKVEDISATALDAVITQFLTLSEATQTATLAEVQLGDGYTTLGSVLDAFEPAIKGVLLAALNAATDTAAVLAVLADAAKIYTTEFAAFNVLEAESKTFAAAVLLANNDYENFDAAVAAFGQSVALVQAAEAFLDAANAADVAGLSTTLRAAVDAIGTLTLPGALKEDIEATAAALDGLATGRDQAAANDLKANGGTGWTLVDLYTGNMLALGARLVEFREVLEDAIAAATAGDLTRGADGTLEGVLAKLAAIKTVKSDATINGQGIDGIISGKQALIARLDGLSPDGRFDAFAADLAANAPYSSFTNMIGTLEPLLSFREAVQTAVEAGKAGTLGVTELAAVQTKLAALDDKSVNGATVDAEDVNAGFTALIDRVNDLVPGRLVALQNDLGANADSFGSFTGMIALFDGLLTFREAVQDAVTAGSGGSLTLDDIEAITTALKALPAGTLVNNATVADVIAGQKQLEALLGDHQLDTGRFAALVADLGANAGEGGFSSYTAMVTLLQPLAEFRIELGEAIAAATAGEFTRGAEGTLEGVLAKLDAVEDVKSDATINGAAISDIISAKADLIARVITLTAEPNEPRFEAFVEDLKGGSFSSFTNLLVRLDAVLELREAVQAAVDAVIDAADGEPELTVNLFEDVREALNAIETAGLTTTIGDKPVEDISATVLAAELATFAQLGASTQDLVLKEIQSGGSFTTLGGVLDAFPTALDKVGLALVNGAVTATELLDALADIAVYVTDNAALNAVLALDATRAEALANDFLLNRDANFVSLAEAGELLAVLEDVYSGLSGDFDANLFKLGTKGDAFFTLDVRGTDVKLGNIGSIEFADKTAHVAGNGLVQAIQAAINDAEAGATVLVAAGNYDETLDVNKAVSLVGPNSGTTGFGGRVAEAVIGGKATVSDGGASMSGFTLSKPSTSVPTDGDPNNFTGWGGINLVINGDGATVSDNIVEVFGAEGSPQGSGFVTIASAATFTGNVVKAGAGYNAGADNPGVSSIIVNAGTDDAVTISNNHLLVSTNVTGTPNDADALFVFNAGDVVIDGNLMKGTDGGFVAFGNYGKLTITDNTIETYAKTGLRIFESTATTKPDVIVSGNKIDANGKSLVFIQGAVKLGSDVNGSDFAALGTNLAGIPAIFRANDMNGDFGVFANGTFSLFADQADAATAAGASGVIWSFSQAQFLVFDGMSIQAAVDAAEAGDTINVSAGTFGETVTINEQVTIKGEGVTTVITGGVDIVASGSDAENRVVLKDVKVTNASGDAIDIGAQDFITLSGVTVDGVEGNQYAVDLNFVGEANDILIEQSTFNLADGQVGLKISDNADVSELTVRDSAFNGGQFGFYFANGTEGSGDTVSGTFSDLTFTGQSNVGGSRGFGIYAEKLTNSTMTGITVNATGKDADQNIRGINLNLKNGIFQNISLKDVVLAGFDQAQTVDGYNPLLVVSVKEGASLDGLVLDKIQASKGANFTGSGQIVLDLFHEAFPAQIGNVTVTNSTLTGLVKVQTSDYAAIADNVITGDLQLVIVDQPAAPNDSLARNAVSGSITFLDGRDTVLPEGADNLSLFNGTLIGALDNNQNGTGNAGDNVITGNDGDNVLSGGAGADALYGGAGNDTLLVDTADTVIDGGTGVDTAIFAEGTSLSAVLEMETRFVDVEVIRIDVAGNNATFVVFDGMSIQAAVDAAEAGNTIVVASGSYGPVTLDKGVTLVAADGASPTITGDGVNQGAAVRVADGVDNVSITGFTIATATVDLAAVYVAGNNESIALTSNTITGGSAHAVLTGGGVDGVSLTGNTLSGSGPSAVVYVNGVASLGVSNPSSNVSLIDNTITGNPGAGLLVGLESTGGVVQGNTFSGSASYAALELFGSGVTVGGAEALANSFDAFARVIIDANGNYMLTDLLANNTFVEPEIVLIRNADTGNIYNSLAEAFGDAKSGETVKVSAGELDLSSEGRLTVPAGVTLAGAGLDSDSKPLTSLKGGLLELAAGATVDGLAFIDYAARLGGGEPVVLVTGDGASVKGSTFKVEGSTSYGNEIQVTGNEATIIGNTITRDAAGDEIGSSIGNPGITASGVGKITITGNTLERAIIGVVTAADDVDLTITGNTITPTVVSNDAIFVTGPGFGNIPDGSVVTIGSNIYNANADNVLLGLQLRGTATEGFDFTDFRTFGNDFFQGGSGTDTFSVSSGDDLLDGGAGVDTVKVGSTLSLTEVKRGSGSDVTLIVDGTDTLRNIERLEFTAGSGTEIVSLVADAGFSIQAVGTDTRPDLFFADGSLQYAVGRALSDGQLDALTLGGGTYGDLTLTLDNFILNVAGNSALGNVDTGSATLTLTGTGVEVALGTVSGTLNASALTNGVTATAAAGSIITGGQEQDAITIAAHFGDATFTVVEGSVTVTVGSDVYTVSSVEKLEFNDKTVVIAGAGSTFNVQQAIAAAESGDAVFVAPGVYTETINVNKDVTIFTQNADVAGNGTRAAEAVLEGAVTVTAGASLSGLTFSQTTTSGTKLLVSTSGSDVVSIVNSVFTGVQGESSEKPNTAKALELANSVGPVTISGNLFTGTGDTLGQYSTAAWERGIYANPSDKQLTITGNAFEWTRTAINVDGYDDASTTINGNAFANAGTGISLQNAGAITVTAVTNNSFTGVDTDLNLGNAPGVTFDAGATGNTATDQLTIRGSNSGDVITGTAEADVVLGQGGDDRVFISAGDDFIVGGDGIDTVVIGQALDLSKLGVVGSGVSLAYSGLDELYTVERLEVTSGEDTKTVSLVSDVDYTIKLVGSDTRPNLWFATADFAYAVAIASAQAPGATLELPEGFDGVDIVLAGNVTLKLSGVTTLAKVTATDGVLSLQGSGNATVAELDGTLNATGLIGDLVVSNAKGNIAAAQGALNVSAGDVLSVDADKATEVVLAGDGAVTVTNAGSAGSVVNASDLTGALIVNVKTEADISLTTGSANTTVSGGGGGNLAVNAAALVVTSKLTVEGSSNVQVSDLGADLDAASLSGTLVVRRSEDAEGAVIVGGAGENRIQVKAGDDVTGGGVDDRFRFFDEADLAGVTIAGGAGIDRLHLVKEDADFDLHLANSITSVERVDIGANGIEVILSAAIAQGNGSPGAITVNAYDWYDVGVGDNPSALSGSVSVDATKLTGDQSFAFNGGNVLGGATVKLGAADANLNFGSGIDTVVIAADLDTLEGAFDPQGPVTFTNGDATYVTSGLEKVELVDGEGAITKTVLIVGGSSAFQTIQSAVDAASAGDKILVTAGTYTEIVSITKQGIEIEAVGAATLTGALNIRGDDVVVEGLAITGGGKVSGQDAGIYVAASNVELTGLTLTGPGQNVPGVRAILTESGKGAGLKVTDVTATDWATGIYLNSGATGASVSSSSLTGNYVGMSIDGKDGVTLTGNTFRGTAEDLGLGNEGPDTGQPNIASATGNTFVNGLFGNFTGDVVTLGSNTVVLDTFDAVKIGTNAGDTITIGTSGHELVIGGKPEGGPNFTDIDTLTVALGIDLRLTGFGFDDDQRIKLSYQTENEEAPGSTTLAWVERLSVAIPDEEGEDFGSVPDEGGNLLISFVADTDFPVKLVGTASRPDLYFDARDLPGIMAAAASLFVGEAVKIVLPDQATYPGTVDLTALAEGFNASSITVEREGTADVFIGPVFAPEGSVLLSDGVNFANVAPVLANGAEFTDDPVLESLTGAPYDTVSVGSLVTTLFKDDDVGSSLAGIALVGIEAPGEGIVEGRWQFKTLADAGFRDVLLVLDSEGIEPGEATAMLLANTTELRFVPDAATDNDRNFGRLPELSFVAVDDTQRLQDGGRFTTSGRLRTEDVSDRGAGTPYSADIATYSQTVTALTTPEDFTASEIALAAFAEDLYTEANGSFDENGGSTVASIFAASFGNDSADLKGVVVVANAATTANGAWQYSVSEGVWATIGSVSSSAALFLAPETELRFVPNWNFNGDAPELTVRGLSDATGLTSGDLVNASITGIGTQISASTASLGVEVEGVNDSYTFGFEGTTTATFGFSGNPGSVFEFNGAPVISLLNFDRDGSDGSRDFIQFEKATMLLPETLIFANGFNAEGNTAVNFVSANVNIDGLSTATVGQAFNVGLNQAGRFPSFTFDNGVKGNEFGSGLGLFREASTGVTSLWYADELNPLVSGLAGQEFSATLLGYFAGESWSLTYQGLDENGPESAPPTATIAELQQFLQSDFAFI